MRSLSAGAPPLYGTCTASMPAADLKSSTERCGVLPTPPEPKLSRPGFAFASAMSSCTDLAATEGCTTSMRGEVATSVTGTKSFCGSYGSREYR